MITTVISISRLTFIYYMLRRSILVATSAVFGTSIDKQKKLIIIIALCVSLVVILGGITFAIQSSTKEISDVKSDTDTNVSSKEATREVAESLENEQESNETPQAQAETPRTSNSTAAGNNSVPQPLAEQTPPPTQRQAPAAEVATCNEAMKTSYTNLYSSLITAENTRWSNQQDAIRADAQRRGMGFSGIVQAEIDAARPTHDANIASIEAQYAQNLYSINCL